MLLLVHELAVYVLCVLQYAIIDGFFEREEQRLVATTKRMAARTAEKKSHDAAKVDQDKVP